MDYIFSSDTTVTIFLSAYLLVLGLVCVYGLHRYLLVHLFYKYRRNTPKLRACFVQRPKMTVQLPMYNESSVA